MRRFRNSRCRCREYCIKCSDECRVIRAAGRRDIFLNGIGTGLDLQYLPTAHRYTALDLKPGGVILILDKFLRPGASAPLRRLISPIAARIATRTDVVFESVLATAPELSLKYDEPALAGGWFRRIQLVKR